MDLGPHCVLIISQFLSEWKCFNLVEMGVKKVHNFYLVAKKEWLGIAGVKLGAVKTCSLW